MEVLLNTRDQVYLKFGQAAEAAQLFETSLGTLLLGMKGLEQGWCFAPNPSAAGIFLENLANDTLGALLKKLKRYDGVHTDLVSQFFDALKARNSLIHGFFLKHNLGFQTEAGRARMLEDLENIHSRLFDAWRIADAISATVVGVFNEKKKPQA